MSKLTKEQAYRIVFNDLEKIPMFRGIYDARRGNESFMYGIETVMETIALGVSEDMHDQFCDIFTANMIGSEDRAKQIEPTIHICEIHEDEGWYYDEPITYEDSQSFEDWQEKNERYKQWQKQLIEMII